MARNTNIKLRRSATAGAKPTTSNLDLGELALNTYDGKLYAKTTEGSASEVIQVGSATDSYHKIRKSQTLTFTVTVAAKTTDHTHSGSGSSSGYYINGLQSPHLHLVPGNTYKFDQSDSSNSGHPLRFYYEADRTTSYTTNVTTNGTAGSSGAYTEITVTDTTPMVLHYQCSAHGYMGGRADFGTRNFTGFDTDDLTEGSTNLYYTTARANSDFDTRFATKSTSDLTEGSNLYYTSTRANTDFDTRLATKTTDNLTEGSSNLYHTTNRVRSALSAGTGISYNSSTGVITNTITQYADSDTRLAISVTDAGGDGSLTYNNSNGVITYTGPSASEVRAHFSAGTGVSISSGQISIGQAVATTSDVQFNDVQVDGTLTSDDITSTNISVAGNATITGNLTVQGTTTTVNSNTVNIGDNIIVLNSDETGTPSQNAGIEVERGTATNKTFVWDETNDRWTLGSENLVASTFIGNLTGNVTGNVTGTVSSLSNFDTGDLTEGSNLYYTNARADARIAAASIGDLSNVDITTNAPSSGQILKWNGTNFVPSADLSGASASNSFETISVSGQSNVVADSSTDTLTLIAGTGMSISTNATNDEITFTSTATGTVTEAFKNVAVSGQSNIVADAAADTLTFAAGSGISLTTDASTDTLTITSTATGSVTEAFKTIAVSGQSNVVADSATDTLTLVAGSGMTISTNATNDEITFASSGGGASQSGVFTEFTFTATSNQTTFSGSDDNSATLSYNASAVQVFLNGVLQENGTDYTATNGSSVVLVNAASSGDILQVSAYTQVLGFGDSALSELTGDGTTTAFTIAANPNNENNTQVYIDGVYQEKATYSVSGTTLTFSSAPPNGTSIEVVIGSRNVSVDDVNGLTVAADLTLSGLSAQNSEATSLMINGSNIVGTRELGSNAFTSDLSAYDTDNLTEGSSNLYYTDARVDSRLASGSLATISTSGNVTVGGNLTVSGTTTTLNTATLDVEDKNITLNYGSGDTSSTADGAGITIQDAVSSSSDATILWDGTNDEFDFSHDINITGGLTTSAASDLNSDINISGTVSLDGTANELRFYEGSNYVGFEAPALSGDQIWVLPDSDGTAGHALKTDGSGNLSWGTAGDNAFKTIAISGQSDVVADSTSDTLTFSAGTGITLTTDASTDTITITNSSLGANAFGTIAVSGQSDVDADSTSDTLTLVGQNGVSITTDASSDTVTIDGRTSYSPFTTDLFTTANATTTDFVLSVTPSSEDNLIVFVEGVYQNKNSYSLSSNTLTLSGAPGSGEEVVVHIVSDLVSGQSLVRNNFTGDNSTTDFTLTLAPMNENNTFVYLDGVYQEKSEYSVSGTTLSFTGAPASGDSIEVIIPKTTELQQPAVGSIDDATMYDTTAILPQTVTSTTVASTSATTIATHAAATYRTIKYLVQCTQGTDYHSTEINLIHDGTTVYITEYGTLFDNAALGTFDATISGGNVLLQITAGSATSMAVKVVSSAIPV